MRKQTPHIQLSVFSTLSLLLSVSILLIYKWLLMELGAFLSGFQGTLHWVGTDIVPRSASWTSAQVLWIYLLPFAGLVLLFGLLTSRRGALSPVPQRLKLIWSWISLLTMLHLFFMPMWEIYFRQGIYFPLSYLFIPRSMQGIFGLALWTYLIFRIFSPAAHFSTLMFGDEPYRNFRLNLVQMVPLLFIPYILYIFLWWIATGFVFTPLNELYFTGLLLALLANSWLMSKYNVIVTGRPKS